MESVSQNGSPSLEARLNNPETASALNRLLDRMDAIEAAMQQLSATIGQGPALVAMVGDMADDAYRTAAASGINVEERVRNGLHLLTRLTEPKIIAQLEGLLALAEQAPGLAAMAGDVVDNAYRNAATHGIDLEARTTTALHLLNRLTEPKMVEQVEGLLALADQVPGFLAMTGDVVDDAFRSATNAGVDIEMMIKQGGVAVQRFSNLMSSPEFTALMDSGMLDPKAVKLLGEAATALVESQQQHPQKIGPVGLLGALRDPDIQKALGFFMTFAKAFGQRIE
ncbi:MAG: DUF1641 domain-containing protein [Caldilineaceae bacterium]|nr:DUF1641 domain-containing protein [Caldilineaceae bacterium]